MVEVGKKEKGFVGLELGKKSPGLSGEFVFGFVNFRWWPVEDTIDWYSRQELLHYMSVYGLFVMQGSSNK